MYYHNPIVLTSGEIPQVTVVEVTVASELKLPNKDIITEYKRVVHRQQILSYGQRDVI